MATKKAGLLDSQKVQEIIEASKRKEAAAKARALEIFMQLMQLKPFKKWLEQNIVIRDEIDHEKKQIITYVIYKGDLPEAEQKYLEMLRRSQYDWWCETCDQGFGLTEMDDTREDHKPVCAQCGSVLITPERPAKEGDEGDKPD